MYISVRLPLNASVITLGSISGIFYRSSIARSNIIMIVFEKFLGTVEYVKSSSFCDRIRSITKSGFIARGLNALLGSFVSTTEPFGNVVRTCENPLISTFTGTNDRMKRS